MEHYLRKMIFWASLLALLSIAALYTKHLWDEHKDEWRKQHDGIPAVLPSPTSYPKLAEAEGRARLTGLLESNGGCRFPCWWGIVPGKTTLEEAHAFLSPFMESHTQQYLGDDGKVFSDPYYSVPPISIEEVITEDGRVFSLLIDYVPPEYVSNLKLSSIFQTYGMPDEIYIRSPHSDKGDQSCEGEFELFLYYPAKQFAVRYRYLWYPMNRPIQVCGLDQPALAEFYMWEPAFEYASFEEAIKLQAWFPQEPIRTIEDATSWTSESFYKAFRSQEGAAFCIEAPAYDWSYLPGLAASQSPYSFCNETTPTK